MPSPPITSLASPDSKDSVAAIRRDSVASPPPNIRPDSATSTKISSAKANMASDFQPLVAQSGLTEVSSTKSQVVNINTSNNLLQPLDEEPNTPSSTIVEFGDLAHGYVPPAAELVESIHWSYVQRHFESRLRSKHQEKQPSSSSSPPPHNDNESPRTDQNRSEPESELVQVIRNLYQRIAVLQHTEKELLAENQELSRKYIALKQHHDRRARQWNEALRRKETKYEARIADLGQQLLDLAATYPGKLPNILSNEEILSWFDEQDFLWFALARAFAHDDPDRLRKLYPAQLDELVSEVKEFVRLTEDEGLPPELLNGGKEVNNTASALGLPMSADMDRLPAAHIDTRLNYARKLKDRFLSSSARYLLRDQDASGIELLEHMLIEMLDSALRFSCRLWTRVVPHRVCGMRELSRRDWRLENPVSVLFHAQSSEVGCPASHLHEGCRDKMWEGYLASLVAGVAQQQQKSAGSSSEKSPAVVIIQPAIVAGVLEEGLLGPLITAEDAGGRPNARDDAKARVPVVWLRGRVIVSGFGAQGS
ncbi:uncharacterized protein CTHT_0042080 [Thermochaetoides thermophila DSM 1495]|uniref:Uncharacterized protein n=1 Tax=Chaetomium thermophilum (strain DSM 1495 / CBS 144.50 / IMI 039719) TaxID=759272 RepID=G0SAF4_CHATD|nr:hypothetical protein CTHT_0042080 [Thermochaetoides thermophila DSM 1495]EGS19726.1 hypothetical protein CTHT_0042080 [Thermochaetoides thermophila DSM 1495]